jgi:hypothetical protein
MASEREKQLDELRDLQAENDDRRRQYQPSEVHYEVPATNAAGDEEKVVEVHAFGGYAYLNSHGEARLDQTALHVLQEQVRAAFQAVQS